MSGMRAAAAETQTASEGPDYATLVDGPNLLYFDGLGDCQHVLKFDAQKSDRAVHFCVTEQ